MKAKLTNMLRGKERKKEQICKVIDEEDLYTLKINCKGKRTIKGRKTIKGIKIGRAHV